MTSWSRRRVVLAALGAAGVAGCGPRPNLVVASNDAVTGTLEPVFVASLRAFENGEFVNRRAESLDLLRFDIHIPPNRTPGDVTAFNLGAARADPSRAFFAARADRTRDMSTFIALVEAELSRRGTRDVMLFLHGFNNNFGDGIYRTAQIRHDLGAQAVALHLAWPSAANPLGYVRDQDSATFARDGLETLMIALAEAGMNIILVAHSLGSFLAMETLRQLRIGGREDVMARIEGVVLFSPDIDVDVFRSQVRRIAPLPQPFVVFTSQRDRALRLSSRITGEGTRVGNLTDPTPVAEFEVTLIDTSAYADDDDDPLNHFTAVNSPAMLLILGRIAEVNSTLERDGTPQPGLLPGAILTIQNATQIVLDPLQTVLDPFQ